MKGEFMSYKTEISKLLKADFKFRKNKSYYRIKNEMQLAEIWNVSHSSVSNKLNGRSLITREELETYAYSFHISRHKLFSSHIPLCQAAGGLFMRCARHIRGFAATHR